MRLLRLSLKNWRGVEEREVRFAEAGVTVVEGPNESGKSSLVEAIDALFDHFDDTKKREITAVKPVHKDAGAEVEAEISTGPYRFVYSKRFHKRPETRLVVSEPAAESLTGREAHERARAILEQTMDLALWSALRIEQGQEITQANLSQQTSLSAALTKSAGGAAVGDAETSLFDAARAEFLRWFTPTGGVRKETTEAEAELRRLDEALAQDRAELARLVADVERSAQVDRECVEAQGGAVQAAAAEHERVERLREIERMATRLGEMKAKLDAARGSAFEAEQRTAERTALADEAQAATEALANFAAHDDAAGPALDEARKALDRAEAALGSATTSADESERRFAVRQQDFEFTKDALDLQLLSERKARIDAAYAAADAAEETLERNVVTDEVLSKLHKAHVEAESARATLDAGSPELRIHALTGLAASIGGEARPIGAGEDVRFRVSGSLSVVLPGVAEIEVRTGTSTSTLRDAFEAKTTRFVALCRDAGVETLDQAVQANAVRQSAQRDVEARDRVTNADLRDLTRETVAQKVANLERRVASYPPSRVATFALPADFDAAQDALRGAEKAVAESKQARREAERARDAARRLADQLRDEGAKTQLDRVRFKTQADATAARLDAARARASDPDLADRLVLASDALKIAATAHREEAQRLEREQPAAARELAENARLVRQRADERLRAIHDERIAVRERLKERGESGLSERADATEAKLSRARDELARRGVHAAAAKLLFATLDEERSNARRAYVGPLRTRIEELGRIVYGPDFAVELDDATLQIANRTLAGRTVPFESLSGGAKEQLGVISRLACALTVADDGGVPVVFDDTLGNTDPARIEPMGALLALAGRKCQVIVLTCFADRFRHVGGASVVRVG